MLEFDDLSRRFGTLQALDHLTFSVPAGEVFGFLGPNGAGKTTAMRALFGLVSLDAGQVRWKGAAITAEERHRFGYLPEERGLYPGMVVFDQLVYLARLHGLSAADARAAATRWLERLGIAGRRRDKIEALSLGNQQRVQLAAAMVHGPELLLLDEPFSGLDPPGVEVTDSDAGRIRLELVGDRDPQAVLAEARAAGGVEYFAFDRRRLSEVFRQAIEDQGRDEHPGRPSGGRTGDPGAGPQHLPAGRDGDQPARRGGGGGHTGAAPEPPPHLPRRPGRRRVGAGPGRPGRRRPDRRRR